MNEFEERLSVEVSLRRGTSLSRRLNHMQMIVFMISMCLSTGNGEPAPPGELTYPRNSSSRPAAAASRPDPGETTGTGTGAGNRLSRQQPFDGSDRRVSSMNRSLNRLPASVATIVGADDGDDEDNYNNEDELANEFVLNQFGNQTNQQQQQQQQRNQIQPSKAISGKGAPDRDGQVAGSAGDEAGRRRVAADELVLFDGISGNNNNNNNSSTSQTNLISSLFSHIDKQWNFAEVILIIVISAILNLVTIVGNIMVLISFKMDRS